MALASMQFRFNIVTKSMDFKSIQKFQFPLLASKDGTGDGVFLWSFLFNRQLLMILWHLQMPQYYEFPNQFIQNHHRAKFDISQAFTKCKCTRSPGCMSGAWTANREKWRKILTFCYCTSEQRTNDYNDAICMHTTFWHWNEQSYPLQIYWKKCIRSPSVFRISAVAFCYLIVEWTL